MIAHHSFATFTPVIHPFTQVHATFYKQHFVPQFFPQVVPHNIIYHSVPGVIQLVPVVPGKDGDKGTKKPDDMKPTEGKDSKKEETTEEPKKDEKKSDGEDLKA